MKKTRQHRIKKYIYLLLCTLLICSCEDFLEVDGPLGQIESSEVYEDETTATAAVMTLYGKLRDEVLLTGRPEGVGTLMGIYADELDFYGFGGEPMDSFYQHQVYSDDLIVENLWNGSYSLIYMTNATLAGLENSKTLSNGTKAQLRGEAMFIRSLAYFYLVNLFGDIPYPTGTKYETNRNLPKVPVSKVYEMIITDLKEAKSLLGTNYLLDERTRANQMVVAALLARVYLYTKQWSLAETEAGTLINNVFVFRLEPEVSQEFLKESTSTILQLRPKYDGGNTLEASTFLFTSGPPPLVALNPEFIEGMEEGDNRKNQWIGAVTDGTETWYFPYKYKYNSNTGTSIEYSIILRISEQFLIRAEARVKQGNLSGALEDINVIRNRAGLMDVDANSESGIIEAIINERFHELFTEFGHRWFDIKRLDLANEILAPIKSGWKTTDILLPIPEAELMMNPNLNPQNSGY
ncbi:RagB/SusD family nutrient uptake outer membrane protein [Aequorivita sp. CIP111184]|uniref:RagB/SusD family nutrient uptake outer membrane protein n=1 Tax=Aequorivita sp. CIP111184 TaxID=2211356 RepID=UPI000DBC0C54|nr:RagB/SusD family nutrient uptake outer membrane protein [Aequorivita sp. CIP111184]SRX52220.1 SusD-like protein [Aequorivita sp. CIP111184]